MIRKVLVVIALLAGTTFTAPAPLPGQVLGLAGMYECEGVGPDGKKYRGLVEISKNDHTYRVRWKTAPSGTGSTSVGIGIVNGDKLAVSFFNAAMTGVALYKIEQGPRLVGEWTVMGAEGVVFSETLTRLSVRASTPADAVRSPRQVVSLR